MADSLGDKESLTRPIGEVLNSLQFPEGAITIRLVRHGANISGFTPYSVRHLRTRSARGRVAQGRAPYSSTGAASIGFAGAVGKPWGGGDHRRITEEDLAGRHFCRF